MKFAIFQYITCVLDPGVVSPKHAAVGGLDALGGTGKGDPHAVLAELRDSLVETCPDFSPVIRGSYYFNGD